MTENKVATLVKQVLERTRSGELAWQETASEDIFSVVIAGGKYILKSFNFTDWDDTHNHGIGPPSLALYKGDNKMVIDIRHDLEGVDANELRSIHSLAMQKALGIDESIDEVIKSLGI